LFGGSDARAKARENAIQSTIGIGDLGNLLQTLILMQQLQIVLGRGQPLRGLKETLRPAHKRTSAPGLPEQAFH
jgi:hypothetical protein